MAGALRIFSRLAELLDVRVARAEAVWIRVDAEGTTAFLTRAEALAALLPADPAAGQVLGYDGENFVWVDGGSVPGQLGDPAGDNLVDPDGNPIVEP